MERLILLHLAAGVVTTVAYRLMTGDSPVYIMAMIALYLWTLVTLLAGAEEIKELCETIKKHELERRRRKDAEEIIG